MANPFLSWGIRNVKYLVVRIILDPITKRTGPNNPSTNNNSVSLRRRTVKNIESEMIKIFDSFFRMYILLQAYKIPVSDSFREMFLYVEMCRRVGVDVSRRPWLSETVPGQPTHLPLLYLTNLHVPRCLQTSTYLYSQYLQIVDTLLFYTRVGYATVNEPITCFYITVTQTDKTDIELLVKSRTPANTILDSWSFTIPIVSCEPRDHLSDCYFGTTKIKGINNKSNAHEEQDDPTFDNSGLGKN